MKLTKHSKKRMKERCGLNKSSYERMAQKALTDGVKHSETRGRLNKWITSLYFTNEKANNIRIYGDKAFLFADTLLITVIQIPNNLVNLANQAMKNKKERDNEDKDYKDSGRLDGCEE